jgi:hypothetical protein
VVERMTQQMNVQMPPIFQTRRERFMAMAKA